MNEPYKRSPIQTIARSHQVKFDAVAGWQLPRQFSDVAEEVGQARETVALLDESANGKIRIEGRRAAEMLQLADLAAGEGRQMAFGQAFRLRQDLVFVKSSPERAEEAVTLVEGQLLSAADLITVTDMTHGYAELRLVGPASRTLLSRLCGLDFQEGVFPNMSVRQSSVAKTGQIIVRCDLADLLAFAIVGPRSLAAYLWRTMLQAGQDLGICPMGQAALASLRLGQAG